MHTQSCTGAYPYLGQMVLCRRTVICQCVMASEYCGCRDPTYPLVGPSKIGRALLPEIVLNTYTLILS